MQWLINLFHIHPVGLILMFLTATFAMLAVISRAGFKRIPILFAVVFGFIAAGCLASCASFQSQTPQQKLDSVKLGVTAAETFYHGLCNSPKAPAVCSDPKASAIEQSAEITVAAAISAAQVVITNGTSSSDQTDALVAAALSAAIAIEQAVAAAQSPPA